jgi:hypothetical protein
VNWNEAQEYCQQKGLEMAMLKTSNELKLVAEPFELREKGKKEQLFVGEFNFFFSVAESNWFWLSASDIGRTPHGQFQWEDGTPVERTAWARQQPDEAGAGEQTCVYFLTGDYKLYDNRCSRTSGILCEFPLVPNACS